MLKNLSETDWRIIDCAVQAIIALLAWIAIIYTRKTIGNRTRIKLKVRYEFTASVMHALKETQYPVEISVRIVNLGMAPVYIEELGLSLWKLGVFKHGKKQPIWVAKSTEEVIELLPGKPVLKTAVIDKVDGRSSDRVRFYSKYLLGKIYYCKAREPFNDFYREFEQLKVSAMVSAGEINDIANSETGGKK